MVLLEKDGITVQARSEREEADYKKLGFHVVSDEPPAKKSADKEPAKKPAKEPVKEGDE